VAAYVIVNIAQVIDADAYAHYRARVSAGVSVGGGRYLVGGGELEVLEGQWRPNRLVVLEFASADQARAWWTSPAYAGLKSLRQASTVSEMVLVDGVPGGMQ
jgi:uncharacterized protein (DUF1330 family)